MQTFWASSIEERAKVDLKFHFMKKTLNEVVSTLVLPPYALYLQQPVPYPGRQALAALAFSLLTQLLSRTDLSFGVVPHAHG